MTLSDCLDKGSKTENDCANLNFQSRKTVFQTNGSEKVDIPFSLLFFPFFQPLTPPSSSFSQDPLVNVPTLPPFHSLPLGRDLSKHSEGGSIEPTENSDDTSHGQKEDEILCPFREWRSCRGLARRVTSSRVVPEEVVEQVSEHQNGKVKGWELKKIESEGGREK